MMRRPIVIRRRWLGAALIASLAVNAFFVGAAATGAVRSTVGVSDGKSHSSSILRYELRWLGNRLPDDAMAKVKADVAGSLPEAEVRFDKLRQLRAGFGDLAAAPVPDRAAIDRQFEEIRAELNRLLTETQSTTIDSVLSLPPETRARLATSAAPGS